MLNLEMSSFAHVVRGVWPVLAWPFGLALAALSYLHRVLWVWPWCGMETQLSVSWFPAHPVLAICMIFLCLKTSLWAPSGLQRAGQRGSHCNSCLLPGGTHSRVLLGQTELGLLAPVSQSDCIWTLWPRILYSDWSSYVMSEYTRHAVTFMYFSNCKFYFIKCPLLFLSPFKEFLRLGICGYLQTFVQI